MPTNTIITTASSCATVAQDLITDRSIAIKITMCVLCGLQLVLAWLSAILCTVAYVQESFLVYMVVTWIILLVGNYLITGLANGIVYYNRWKKSAITKRAKTEDENKEAWVFLRLFLTLLGLAPIGRYIETITAIRKLEKLEKDYLPEAVAQQKNALGANASLISGGMSDVEGGGGQGRRPVSTVMSGNTGGAAAGARRAAANSERGGGGMGSRPASLSELKSRSGQQSSASLAGSKRNLAWDSKAQRKVQRARRQMRRCEHDCAQVVLYSGFFAAAPMAVAQIFLQLIYYSSKQRAFSAGAVALFIITTIVSLLWVAAALVHYYPARRMVSETDFERGLGVRRAGLILLYVARLLFISSRCVAFALFTAEFQYWIFVCFVCHWLLCFGIFILYRCYTRPFNAAPDSVSQRLIGDGTSVWDYLLYAYIGLFDFINGNEGKTRARYIIYYVIAYLENIALAISWYILMPDPAVWFRLPLVILVLVAFAPSFLCLQLYYFYYHSNKGSVSLCGFCQTFDESRHRELYSRQQLCEPTFGVPVAQTAVPFYTPSRVSEKSPAASKSQAGTASIMSSSYAAGGNNRWPMSNAPSSRQGRPIDEESTFYDSVSAAPPPALPPPNKQTKPPQKQQQPRPTNNNSVPPPQPLSVAPSVGNNNNEPRPPPPSSQRPQPLQSGGNMKPASSDRSLPRRAPPPQASQPPPPPQQQQQQPQHKPAPIPFEKPIKNSDDDSDSDDSSSSDNAVFMPRMPNNPGNGNQRPKSNRPKNNNNAAGHSFI